MPKKKVKRVHITPVVTKVTVTDGQARVNLPKKIALRLNLIDEGVEPGKLKNLLLFTQRKRLTLFPVEMTEVEAV